MLWEKWILERGGSESFNSSDPLRTFHVVSRVWHGIMSYARHAAKRTLRTRTRGVREMSTVPIAKQGPRFEGCVA